MFMNVQWLSRKQCFCIWIEKVIVYLNRIFQSTLIYIQDESGEWVDISIDSLP